MPIFTILFFYFGLEIYVLVKVWGAYGFVNTFFALLVGAFLGAGLARTQGRFILQHLKESVARSQMPTDRVLHGMLVFVAGLLLIVPGFVSDALALLLVLPGTRHLAVALVKRHFKQQVVSGRFRAFTFGGSFGQRPPFGAPDRASNDVRDVTPKIIDVTPISRETNGKPSP